MRNIPPIALAHEEPAYPAALRTPLDAGPLRDRFAAAAQALRDALAAGTPSADEHAALTLAERLLNDWLRRGLPPRAPAERITALAASLTRHGFADVAAEVGERFLAGGDVGSAGLPRPAPKIIIRTPPPANEVGLASWFAPPAWRLDLARQQLDGYQRWLRDQSDLQPVVLPRYARLTGLPRFMNGRLPTVPANLEPAEWAAAAHAWLFASPTSAAEPPMPAACLFGLDDQATAQAQLAPLDAVLIPASRTMESDDGLPTRLAPTVHMRFQQKFGAWPVLGGRVIVHMAADDPRCSVSSSYLPIPADRFAHYQLRSEAEAITIALRALAQHALRGGMEEVEALGLYLTVLDRWLADGQADLADDEWPVIAPAMAQVVADRVRASPYGDALADPLTRLEDALAGQSQARLPDARHALHEIQAGLPRAMRWDAGQVIPYLPHLGDASSRSDKCFVMPFLGEYYLAYRVEFVARTRTHGWRVYVNADASDTSCDVLGWPESLMAHAIDVFPTSAAAASDASQPVNTHDIDLAFMTPRWHEDAVAGAPTWTVADLEANPHVLDAGLIQDAANIAYHASAFYRYFSALCQGQNNVAGMLEDASRTQPYFTVEVGAAAGPGDPLSTGFLASAAAPTIVFQSADTLQVGVRSVRRPARDPEVAAHELAHALMWLMNSEPFDMSAGVTPFARALVEGYANYYARAYAVSKAGDLPQASWARGCYRSEVFGDRFDLSRDSVRDPAGNLLPFPNLYPPAATADPDAADSLTIQALQKYSVGMVWARALWELRQQYSSAGLDPLVVDRWALNAYFYMPGWLASFETAAEGILDQQTSADAAALAGRFGARNILAGRGVQALALAGAEVLVGADVGVRRSPAAAIAWGGWESFPAGEGVTGLAHDPTSDKVFAATERGVYVWDAGLVAWTPHGTWKTELAQQTPLCLAAADGMVYAGTARGLYALAAATPAGDWTRWEGRQNLEYLVRDVAVTQGMAGGVSTTIIYAATLREARKRTLPANRPPANMQWVNAAPASLQAAMGPTTAAALLGDAAYLGTLQGGVWRQGALSNNAQWTQIAAAADIGAAAVLTLRPRVVGGITEVLVGTTAGLFLGREVGNWNWSEIAFDNDPNAHEAITALLYLDDTTWLVGTANRALWHVAVGAGGQRTWTQYADIGL